MKIMYIVYQTTNLINGKIYVGVHRTNVDIFDFYYGCGCSKKDQKKSRISGFPAAIRKYGIQNFKRETLFEYPDTEEGKLAAFKKEEEIVTDEFIKRPDTYNLTKGGRWTVYETLRKPIAQYSIECEVMRVQLQECAFFVQPKIVKVLFQPQWFYLVPPHRPKQHLC